MLEHLSLVGMFRGIERLMDIFRGFNRERFEPWILKSATDHWHDFSPCIGADFAYKMGRWGTERLPPEMERMYISPYRSGFGWLEEEK